MSNVTRAFFAIMLMISLGFYEAVRAETPAETPRDVRVGVLAHMGKDRCRENWQPTMDYLTAHIPAYKFTLVPLTFVEIDNAIVNGLVEFIIANSSIYIELEVKYRVSRIATMENLTLGKGYTMFGGVIFTRADRSDINKIEDLRRKRFMGVDKTSLGGWRMAWGELKKHGINPWTDLSSVEFTDRHQNVVHAVKNGTVDAGTVRTDTLERMAAKKEIDINEFKVIKYKGKGPNYDDFPFHLSTPLYPEWPIAKVKHTPNIIAKLTASALLEMPKDSTAAKAANIEGWTIPLNYEAVDDLLKYLRVSPYEDYGKVTWRDILRDHWITVTAIAVSILAMAIFLLYISRLNMRLNESQQKLAHSYEKLEEANTHIMDSIQYASSIQRAILPQIQSLNGHMAEYFVIWRPRDVIGGDIFWFYGQHSNFMIAIIDCTGHGVPGAIMTMLAGTTLNRVVNESGYADPSKILTRMNILIRATLAGEKESVLYDNGLDIGICCVDKQTKTLTFAGAKISLFFASGPFVHEIKGDHESVGYQTSKPDYVFTNHTINIADEMNFYMMTDGMAGQVGGVAGIPFGKKRFREFIAANNTKPFQDQHTMLIELYDQYRADETQRDDVTVIGFRV
ncbi:MAG: PhnD/SsuA/transferrin family substrate-binding protein [Nitrospirae bacterium]|nr:PhnD/SsuA/transferrin family substrate-binding protein [Nitrospirota bacterium]